jgi:transcriptional regulator with XRE-family HTH domain
MKIYWNGTSKNIIGSKIRQLRQEKGLSQAALASQLQLLGMECSDLTILRIECNAAK